MNIKKSLIILSIFMFLKSNVHSMESASIIYKINNEIISNIDIEDETRYLIALNNQLKTMDDETISKIAEESLIKEKIKKNELLKYYLLDQKNPNLDSIIKTYFLRLGINTDDDFDEYLKGYDLKIEDIRKKMEIEATWNELIYTKYNSFLQIDKKKLRIKLKNQKPDNVKSYLISEIIFEDNSNKDKYDLIKESIEEIGFSNTANIYSISDTSKFGGKIGWVKEQNLNEKILIMIKNLEIGLNTQPFQVGSNFLILRLEDIKVETKDIDEEKALKQLIDFEIQRQMDRFSKTYYNKVKLNAQIEKK